MKFKTTFILLAVFLGLLAFVLFFQPKKKEDAAKEDKLVDLVSGDVRKITLKKEDETISFRKDENGDWFISEPLEAKADNYEVNRLAEDFSSLRVERVVAAESGNPAEYEIPKKEVTLWYQDRPQPVKILIGMENPIDSTLFAKKDDDNRIVLIPGSLKSIFEKKTFDFRQKDIFKFETGDVAGIRLRAGEIRWEASKNEDEWFLKSPVVALAKKSRVEDVLNSLSGIRAKEFASEEKTPEEVEKFGLKAPEYEATLSLPAKNQEIVFTLHKDGDKIFATTSLSPKIIVVEGQVLTDLEKKIEDLREKQVVVFNSWEANKIIVKKESLNLTLFKDKYDKWRFEDGDKAEAEGSKVEGFIRKVENLEAAEFIDKPSALKDYGLDPAGAEVIIWTNQGEDKAQEFHVLLGTEDQEKKQLVARNPKLEYLFRVDSGILAEFPKEPKDWKPPAEEKKK